MITGEPSQRLNRWRAFNEAMEMHVEHYTVPQYGDYPDDQLNKFTEHNIKKNLERYHNRMDSNARGREEKIRDYLKIAHYISELFVREIEKGDKDEKSV